MNECEECLLGRCLIVVYLRQKVGVLGLASWRDLMPWMHEWVEREQRLVVTTQRPVRFDLLRPVRVMVYDVSEVYMGMMVGAMEWLKMWQGQLPAVVDVLFMRILGNVTKERFGVRRAVRLRERVRACSDRGLSVAMGIVMAVTEYVDRRVTMPFQGIDTDDTCMTVYRNYMRVLITYYGGGRFVGGIF